MTTPCTAKDTLDRIENKLDIIDEKLNNHLERLAIVEERERTTRGSVVILFTVLMTVAGWFIYKLKIGI